MENSTSHPQDAAAKYAFIIHPLKTSMIANHRLFWWVKYIPEWFVEWVAVRYPPVFAGKVKGVVSPANGKRADGYLIALGGTPRALMNRPPEAIYRQLIRAGQMAHKKGCQIMGLGAFTSVIGDAGVTVAQQSHIAITTGNSLTVAATLETARAALIAMGAQPEELPNLRAMVVGATGSIGSACARSLAPIVPHLVLVAPREEKLRALQDTILTESPFAQVDVSTVPDEYLSQMDLIITATSAVGHVAVNIGQCKPGAVICDIARPPDISPEESALRPDVLVIESGEIILPGEVEVTIDIGLPQGVVYACLAETVLLALEDRFENYTLGREIDLARVKEIDALYHKHGCRLSAFRSHGQFLTEEDIAAKRAFAAALRQDKGRLARLQQQAAALQVIRQTTPVVTAPPRPHYEWIGLGFSVAAAALTGFLLWRRKQES
jgi:predicted amino acid dehydrogenase